MSVTLAPLGSPSPPSATRPPPPPPPSSQEQRDSIGPLRSLKTLEDPLSSSSLARTQSTGTARLELEGGRLRLYPTRSGRGEAFGEPVSVQVGGTTEEIVYICFEEGDEDNPINWSPRKKMTVLYIIVFLAGFTALNVTAYSSGYASANAHFSGGVDLPIWTLANTLHFLTIAIAPLALAPSSELFGRLPLFHYSTAIMTVLFVPQALAPSMTGIVVARGIQGIAASVGNSCVGGAIADMYEADDRGAALNLFSLFIFVGQAIGPGVFSWINQILGYKWMFWILLILSTISLLLNVLFLSESRANVVLARRAAALTKQTGRVHAPVGESAKEDFVTMVRLSISRPIAFLCTEPIVAYISVWVATAWGIIFLFIASITSVFSQYGWSLGQSGSALWTIAIGGVLGYLINMYQDHLYHRVAIRTGRKPEPEARLYCASVAAFVFPFGILMYAWTGRPGVNPAAPIVALAIVFTSIFIIYSAVFNVLADIYEKYSSSAQAAQSLARNIFAGAFPLFAPAMFAKLGLPYASTLLGCLGLVLGFCPLVLIVFGRRLRAMSKVACRLRKEAEEEEEAEMARRRQVREGKSRKEVEEGRVVAEEVERGGRRLVR